MSKPLMPTEVRPRRTLAGTSIRAFGAFVVLLMLGLVAWANIDWDWLWPRRKGPAAPASVAEKTSTAASIKAVSAPSNAAILEAQKSVVLLQADGPGGLVGV